MHEEHREKREHNLCQTYLRRLGRLVSTAYRESSVCCSTPPWYYETIVWEWDEKTREMGDILFSEDSGSRPQTAFKRHQELCRKLFNNEPLEDDEE